jgi:CubicO group peptidase (beta-lactamase class C family)
MGTHDLAAPDYVDGRPAVPRDWVRNMRNLRMTSEPRTKFVYCNFMFVALSHVIETVTGRWLGDLLRERIWGPLGMKATYFELSDALDAPEHFANGYAWNSTAEKFERIEYMNVTAVTGAGAVISNVKDYAKWVRCLINGGGPLSEEVRKDIMTPRSIMSDTPGGGVDVTLYGAGWMRTTFHGRVLYHHSGGMHAYGAEVYWLPDDKFGVVSFGNTATTSNHVQEILIYRLMEEKLGIPAEHRYDLDSEYVYFQRL